MYVCMYKEKKLINTHTHTHTHIYMYVCSRSWVQIPLRSNFYSYFLKSFIGEYH